MEELEDLLENGLIKFDYSSEFPSILKVVGVGGGGGNAVTQMYNEGIRNVTFVLCNTDQLAMRDNPIPTKVQLGPGLGAGGDPNKAREYAEDSLDKIKKMFSDGTEMAFITAGMGGGTGTGASPVVAKVARDLGILTIGIVTIPFLFEGSPRIIKALKGVEEIKKNVDALLVINNELLREKYADFTLLDAFKIVDDTLLNAVRSISEIITVPGYINRDFADVKTVLKNGGGAVMSNGLAKGDNRVTQAIKNATNSPLLKNNDIFKAKRILLNISFGKNHALKVREIDDITNFVAKFGSIEVFWGTTVDESLDEEVKVAVLASGYDMENIISNHDIAKASQDLTREQKEEEDRKIREEEVNRRKELEMMEHYYGHNAINLLGKPTPACPFIFSEDNIDDNETIEAVLNNPAYNRSDEVRLDIYRKAEARKK